MGASAEGTVPAIHFPTTRFVLSSPRTGEIPVFQVGERQRPIGTTNAPDRSVRTTGETEPQEVEFSVALSNEAAVQLLHSEWALSQGRVFPGYRQDWTLVLLDVSETRTQVETLVGGFISGNTRPELDKSPDGSGGVASEKFRLSFSKVVITPA